MSADPEVLSRYGAVTFETAAQLLNISARQLRHLVQIGKLEKIGSGQRRRIKSDSIAHYGAFTTNPEPNG
ncbi:MAG TPA: helix-turn-helix domain-containing protein [Bryobacteraceae bacterium]|jgi:excisionase family DNA binding protein|nr:helix-turn-helix domain-containing protein [Bryobacteraceae bacterium]